MKTFIGDNDNIDNVVMNLLESEENIDFNIFRENLSKALRDPDFDPDKFIDSLFA